MLFISSKAAYILSIKFVVSDLDLYRIRFLIRLFVVKAETAKIRKPERPNPVITGLLKIQAFLKKQRRQT
jgi:hypothetical protein